MHLINSVSVSGFWGTHDIELKVFPDVTFLIGPNGTGKTTLINLVAAALTADFRTLDRIAFRHIALHVADGKSKAEISVEKKRRKDRPFESIEYTIRRGDQKELRFSLDDSEEQFLVRRLDPDHPRVSDFYRRLSHSVTAALQDLVAVNWLSIHRTQFAESRQQQTESLVDKKLVEQSNEIVRYFSTFSQSGQEEFRKFQEHIFISFLEHSAQPALLHPGRLANTDKFKLELAEIFDQLRVKRNTDELIEAFFSEADRLRAKAAKSSVSLDLHELTWLMELERIEKIVEKWGALQKALRRIFIQRDRFAEILSRFLERKTFAISASNEFVFTSRTGKSLSTQMLSSGEKQLIILLSEVLLQKEQPAILIADEPELSLHVLWQEKLVASLRELNPKAQIIIATHSPDIVGPLEDRALDMETLIP